MLACSMQTRSGGLFDTSHKIAALNFLSGKQKKKKKKKYPHPSPTSHFHENEIIFISIFCLFLVIVQKYNYTLK